MYVKSILEFGYVVMCSNGEYVQSNVGLFITKRNAERQCEICNRVNYYKNKGTWEVVKVYVVTCDE